MAAFDDDELLIPTNSAETKVILNLKYFSNNDKISYFAAAGVLECFQSVNKQMNQYVINLFTQVSFFKSKICGYNASEYFWKYVDAAQSVLDFKPSNKNGNLFVPENIWNDVAYESDKITLRKDLPKEYADEPQHLWRVGTFQNLNIISVPVKYNLNRVLVTLPPNLCGVISGQDINPIMFLCIDKENNLSIVLYIDEGMGILNGQCVQAITF